MRIEGYCRVTTKEQAKVKAQTDDLIRYAQENGHEEISIISDCGVSGIRNAASMKHLLRMAQRGDMDAVLCMEPSRISRDPGQFWEWLKALQNTGTRIEFVEEPHRLSEEFLGSLSRINAMRTSISYKEEMPECFQ